MIKNEIFMKKFLHFYSILTLFKDLKLRQSNKKMFYYHHQKFINYKVQIKKAKICNN